MVGRCRYYVGWEQEKMERMWDHWIGEMVLSFHLLSKQTPANQREKLKRQQPFSNNSDSREHLIVSQFEGAPFTSHGTVPTGRHSHAFKVNGAYRTIPEPLLRFLRSWHHFTKSSEFLGGRSFSIPKLNLVSRDHRR